MVEVFGVKILRQFDHFKLQHLLGHNVLTKIKQYYNIQDMQRTVVGDLLVRSLLSNKLNLSNKQLRFSTDKYGKPFLLNTNKVHYNISHSGEWVVCGIDYLPLGIDIEEILPINFEIAKRFFTKDEYNDLLCTKESERLKYFYSLWTLKESYLKAKGEGLSLPLNSFSVKINGSTIKLQTQDRFEKWSLRQYNFDSNYKLSLCAKNDFCNKVIVKEIEELAQELEAASL